MVHPLVSLLRAHSSQFHPDHDPVVDQRVLPEHPGRQHPWPDWVPTTIRDGFRHARGVDQPWGHQVEAWRVLQAGKHLALATPTGSGKSLIAWVPILTEILKPRSGRISEHSHRPTAIYLSPTKALSHDQAQGLRQILNHGLGAVNVGVIDGDASSQERVWAQTQADIIFTNPDFVHHALLPAHHRWVRLLRGLRYVFIDELHAYRGMVGAHVALVIRRLLRLAHRYGARPQVIVASATAVDPGPTVARFLGVSSAEVGVVNHSSAPQGKRTVVLWDPPMVTHAEWSGEEDKQKKSTLGEAADLLTTLVHNGSSTLVFTGSRAATEAIAERARFTLPTHLRSTIAAYRGGFLPEERRSIEHGLRYGELLGVVSTSALEMGVDIPGLDAVIIAGWPGTWASFWQRVGRTGRAGTDGLAVLIASENPLDHYLLNHPEHVFSTPVEATVFDPTNPNVLAPHLCAAAAEAPLTREDLSLFGLQDTALIDELVARGLLRQRPQGWLWNFDRPEHPHDLTDLRGSQGYGVSVVEETTGQVVGMVDSARADSTLHPGAVYIHQGTTYTVVDSDSEVAVVTPTNKPFRTRAFSKTRVKVLSEDESHMHGQVCWSVGDIEVRSQVVSYQKRRLPALEVVGHYPLTMPERMLRTKGVWWSLPSEVLTAHGISPGQVPGSLHAAEHAMISLLGLVATCDRWDLGGLSTALHETTLAPTVFIYDAFPGGAGFARRGFDSAPTWVKATLDAVQWCPCVDGCPRCIHSPKCGNGNSPLDKQGAIATLELLLASFTV